MLIQNEIPKQSPKSRALLAMAQYCVGYLGLSKSKKTLILMISKNQVKEIGAKGITAIEGNNIIVCLDAGIKGDELLMTMAHEMVHAKQLASGLLKYDNEDCFVWRGKEMPEMHYLSRPWEIQAMQQSEILMRRFIDAFNEIVV